MSDSPPAARKRRLKPLPKLPVRDITRERLRDARLGLKRPEWIGQRVAAALRGKPKTPEHRANIAAAQRARLAAIAEGKTPPRSYDSVRKQRVRALDRDLRTAMRLGHPELVLDLIASGGWLLYRTIFDGTGQVSHGFFEGATRWHWKWIPYDGTVLNERVRFLNADPRPLAPVRLSAPLGGLSEPDPGASSDESA